MYDTSLTLCCKNQSMPNISLCRSGCHHTIQPVRRSSGTTWHPSGKRRHWQWRHRGHCGGVRFYQGCLECHCLPCNRPILLPNGATFYNRILAAGGFGASGILATAEVYNTMTSTWNSTGSLATARAVFQMVLLTNDNVLAAGGVGRTTGSIYLDSAEVYNSTTGSWNATGSLATARARFQMVLLPDGNVLAAGGENANGNSLTSAEVYNVAMGTWTTTTSLTQPRSGFQMLLLTNGNVLAAGGFSSPTSAEVYNFTTGTWTATAPLNAARSVFQMVLLPNGNVLAAGDTDIQSKTSSEVYNSTTGEWTTTGNLVDSRQDFQMVGFGF